MKHAFALLLGAVLVAVPFSAGGNARLQEVSIAGKPAMGYIQVKLVNQPITAPVVMFPVRVVFSGSKPLINQYTTGLDYKYVMYGKLKKSYPVGMHVKLCVVTASSKYTVSAACPKTIVVKVKAGRNRVGFTVKWKAIKPPPTTTVTTTTTTTATTTTTTTALPDVSKDMRRNPPAVYWGSPSPTDPGNKNVICVSVNGPDQPGQVGPFTYFGMEVDNQYTFSVPDDQALWCIPAYKAMVAGTTHVISSWKTNGYKVQIDSQNGQPPIPPADFASSTFTIGSYPGALFIFFYFVNR